MASMSLTLSLIICTKDRKEILWKTLDSIFQQSYLPDEIIIIDDGNLPVEELKSFVTPHISKYLYIKKDTPGLTFSRNLGVDYAKGEIILFLDDDVLLDPNYIEEIMSIYANDKDQLIMGVTGSLKYEYNPGVIAFLRFFCMDGTTPGKTLPSGFGVLVREGAIHNVMDVQWLAGCNMSYRRDVFNDNRFDQTLGKYAWGEDKDFSYRLSKKYRLVATPLAKLTHLKASSGRINREHFGYMEIYNSYLFFRKNMAPKMTNWLALFWAFAGILLKNSINLINFNKRSQMARQLSGNIRGLIAIITKKDCYD